MKFLFLTINGVPWGGSEVLWAATANRALNEGHEVFVSMYACEELPAPIQELEKRGAEIHFRRRYYPNLYWRVYKKVANYFLPEGKKKTYHDYILEYKPDHILFSLGQGGEIAQDNTDLMVLVRQLTISYSIFCHELWLRDSNFGEYENNLVECFSKAKKVFFTSEMIMNNTRKVLGEKFENFKVLNHPLQNNSEAATSYPRLNRAKFAMLGSLSMTRKGHDLAIQALSNERWKNRDWELNIYGNGVDELKIRALFRKLGLEKRINMCGFIDNLSEVWRSNHVILLPSRSDSGPIVLFEAMLAARAVIGTNIGAIPEYIVDGENGVLAKDFTVEAFQQALEVAWELKGKWQEWGENARDTMLEKYDFDAAKTLLDSLKFS